MSGPRQTSHSTIPNQNGSWKETLEMTKSALRWDIKRSMKSLCKKLEEIGEECFVVTVNINNGWVGHTGTLRGDEYIDDKSHILYDFLNYCSESVDMDSDSTATVESDSDSNSEICEGNNKGVELSVYDGDDNDNNDDNDDDNDGDNSTQTTKLNGTVNDVNNPTTLHTQNNPATLPTQSQQSTLSIRELLQAPLTSMLRPTQTVPQQDSDSMDSDVGQQVVTESQFIITDVRTQLPENEGSGTVENKTSNPAHATNTRKQTASAIKRKHSVIADDSEKSNDDYKRVTRSKNLKTKKASKKTLAHLLSKRTASKKTLTNLAKKVKTKARLANILPVSANKDCESTVDDEDKSSSSSCDEVVDEDDIVDYIEQDDPNDEDWEIENI